MKLKILELAYLEIENGKEYYNLQEEKLGDKFKKEIQTSIDNIITFPKLYPEVENNIRRCLLHKFPYSIFYTIDNDTIIILSVAHQRRKPYYWIS
ncbi:type II toxin-antitoxin system RelE/ParE family toxin [Hydrogenimonas thermophila]|uniref:Plasmid stabilization system protein ParE n=1 Tax=Hydrogenimonas thermophila TaxID=223786 RepID=A0A1I5STC5_9BACT|nr:type II toxin-antitoxin system RelE/ParE family toxin [Hydrogenimonas thermophila]WOE70250.1 type II toxin-antitoxin system RelE/ParE family toxin [Hydrogenimonas thermophila]WOE72767.1 type II toxin-antitoxin system RelE/ParE family toxin [Hydrogenimonas thermophila]SFP73938.1 Plasmid stabilization system protein ParE [Hydrogenimonas thermophila]